MIWSLTIWDLWDKRIFIMTEDVLKWKTSESHGFKHYGDKDVDNNNK